MRKLLLTGTVYILLLCVPLHLSASALLHGGLGREATSIGTAAGSPSNTTGTSEESESAESIELFGPGKSKRKRHKQKVKRMGGHQNLSDKLTANGIFGKQKKSSGIGQSVLFLVVPAAAVVGLALLFASSTKDKNTNPDPDLADPSGTN